jgi:hypothetical protein
MSITNSYSRVIMDTGKMVRRLDDARHLPELP